MLAKRRLRDAIEVYLGAEAATRVGIGLADTRSRAEGLWPSEQIATGSMVEKRLREFAAGRAAARLAMAELGVGASGVRMAADRAPIWPEGLTGSITHTDLHALSLVAFRRDMRAIGVDLEDAVPLAPDLWNIVLSGAETASVSEGIAAKRIFSAKEAVFKAQYPVTGRLLEFLDVEVELTKTGFAARIAPHSPGLPAILNGLSVVTDGVILSVLSIPETDVNGYDA